MPAALVSICIPVFNGEAHLRDALESALAQSYADCEIIVVDNASTDGTADVLAAIAQRNPRKIRCYRNESTLPMTGNFNLAASKARGEYLVILPHDDMLLPDGIARLMAQTGPGAALIAGHRGFLFDNCSLRQRLFYLGQNLFWRPERRFGSLAVSPARYLETVLGNPCHNMLGEPGSVLISRVALQQVGGFDPRFNQLCDLALWHKLGMSFGLRIVPRRVALFRVHISSQSARNRQDGIAKSLDECLNLSALVLEHCLATQPANPPAAAVANYLLDRTRFEQLATDSVAPGLPRIDTGRLLSNVLRCLVSLPCKRIYQLLLFRAVFRLAGWFGITPRISG